MKATALILTALLIGGCASNPAPTGADVPAVAVGDSDEQVQQQMLSHNATAVKIEQEEKTITSTWRDPVGRVYVIVEDANRKVTKITYPTSN